MKLLFCGGSHLSNFKTHLNAELKEFQASFLVTGGASILVERWKSLSRGWNQVSTSTTSRQTSQSIYKLRQEIFVGQLLQPHRCFYGDRPLSKAMVRDILNPEHFPLWMKSFPSNNTNRSTFHESNTWFYNEPLALFPTLTPGQCISIDDPLPRHPDFASVPNHAKQSFLDAVGAFCRINNIVRIKQHPSTISTMYTTSDHYACTNPEDFTHANKPYWQIIWKDLINVLKRS